MLRRIADKRVGLSQRTKSLDVGLHTRNARRVVDDPIGEMPLALEQKTQSNQHIAFGKRKVSLRHDLLSAREKASIDNRVNYRLAANPEVVRVLHHFLPKPPGRAVVNDVSDIVLVLENTVDHGVTPRPPVLVRNPRAIKLA